VLLLTILLLELCIDISSSSIELPIRLRLRRLGDAGRLVVFKPLLLRTDDCRELNVGDADTPLQLIALPNAPPPPFLTPKYAPATVLLSFLPFLPPISSKSARDDEVDVFVAVVVVVVTDLVGD
jgi:hypothetical protein